MQHPSIKTVFRLRTIFIAFLILCLGGLSIYEYRSIKRLTSQLNTTSTELDLTKKNLEEKLLELNSSSSTLEGLRQAYALSEENGTELLKQLGDEKNRNDTFEDQLHDMKGTVGKLDKLSQLDPELLMKYSKVYFLNEHYMPESVAPIATSSLFKTDEQEYIHKRVAPFLRDMLDDALDDGVTILIASGYRSFEEQKALKGAYKIQYGSGANTFSADQGYSEHQLGTTVDFTTTRIGSELTGFETTDAYAWLMSHAYKYGFVLSYPKGNSYYIFEPWHWRFVGEDLARKLYREHKYFYDMDQRDIDA